MLKLISCSLKHRGKALSIKTKITIIFVFKFKKGFCFEFKSRSTFKSKFPVLANQIQSSNRQSLAVLNCSILSLVVPSSFSVDASKVSSNLPLQNLAKLWVKSSCFLFCNYDSFHNFDIRILHSSTSCTKSFRHILENVK